jgi:phage shock protein C
MLRQGLYRSKSDRMIAGVCGGLAKRFNANATWLRLAFVLFTLLGGAGFLLYLFLWIIMPEESLVA